MGLWEKLKKIFRGEAPEESESTDSPNLPEEPEREKPEITVEMCGPSEEEDISVELFELEESADPDPAEEGIEVEVFDAEPAEKSLFDGTVPDGEELPSRMTDEYQQWMQMQLERKEGEQQ